MNERFHDGLEQGELQALSQRTDAAAAVRAGVQLALLGGSAAVILLASDALPWWTAFLVQVLLQFAMFGMLHETVHGTAFASPRANAVCRWLAAIWQFAPPAWMRAFHFQHHRHTHELALDPELSRMPSMVRWPRGVLWLANASGLPILFGRVAFTLVAATGIPALYRRVLPYVADAARPAVARDARVLLCVHAAIVAIAIGLAPAVAWLYVAALAAHAILSLYIACEHRGLPEQGDVLQRTRSLRAGRLLRFLLWNMPWHAEHHAYPSVPFHALPALHELLRPRLVHSGRSVLDLHLHPHPH